MKRLTKKEQEAIRKAKNAYQREYYRKNKEKKQEAISKYWLKKAAELGWI